jgi:hypothetical protein
MALAAIIQRGSAPVAAAVAAIANTVNFRIVFNFTIVLFPDFLSSGVYMITIDNGCNT